MNRRKLYRIYALSIMTCFMIRELLVVLCITLVKNVVAQDILADVGGFFLFMGFLIASVFSIAFGLLRGTREKITEAEERLILRHREQSLRESLTIVRKAA